MPIKLIDLVIAKLQEERTENFKAACHTDYDDDGGGHCNLYMNNIYLGKVYATHVIMWAPKLRMNEKHEFHATDPKFFEHIIETTKPITQRHIELADKGLQQSQYFRW